MRSLKIVSNMCVSLKFLLCVNAVNMNCNSWTEIISDKFCSLQEWKDRCKADMCTEEKISYIKELNDFSVDSLASVSDELRNFIQENKLSGFITHLDENKNRLMLGPAPWSEDE